MSEEFSPKRALISVSNKEGLLPLCQTLASSGVELISTGGTYAYLQENGFSVTKVSDVTKFPEMMGGRVKTLHPFLLGGLLGRREEDKEDARAHGIEWVDIVVCNLYPFEETTSVASCTLEKAVETIDIGGPTMLRAAAKNYQYVAVLSSPKQYANFCERMKSNTVDLTYRQRLAIKTFKHTSQYDEAIYRYFDDDALRAESQILRYGENPHQSARAFHLDDKSFSVLNVESHQGKALSYNNLIDAQAAVDCVRQFTDPTSVIIKHATPCGAATASNIHEAFIASFNADSKSAFGGIVAINQACDDELAKLIVDNFVEVVIAPEFSAEALQVFSTKKNLRILSLDFNLEQDHLEKRYIPGGFLLQETDHLLIEPKDLKQVAGPKLEQSFYDELCFAWQVVKKVKSNAIVVAKDSVTLGISGGQVSRVDAVSQALNKADGKCLGAVLASDAFFPFRDSIDMMAEHGIAAIIQPGGSMRDSEVINACDEHQIAMFFTGARCFKH